MASTEITFANLKKNHSNQGLSNGVRNVLLVALSMWRHKQNVYAHWNASCYSDCSMSQLRSKYLSVWPLSRLFSLHIEQLLHLHPLNLGSIGWIEIFPKVKNHTILHRDHGRISCEVLSILSHIIYFDSYNRNCIMLTTMFDGMV